MAEKYTTLESIESKQKHKIPDNIWETDCKYCRFRQTEENFEYGSRGRYDQPCAISRFNGKCGIWDSESKELKTEHEIYTEHCGSARPNEGFGICATCDYFNGFHDNVEDETAIYCIRKDGPVNRRNTMPWVHAGYSKKVTSFDYSYFTCDKYKVDCGCFGIGKDGLIKKALEGRIPMNFNPDTMQPLEYIDGEAIEEWKARQEKHEKEKPENVKKRKLQDAIKQRIKKTEVTNADTSNNG